MNSFDLALFQWFNSLVFLGPPAGGWIDAWIYFKAEFLGWWLFIILGLLVLYSKKRQAWLRVSVQALVAGLLSRIVFIELIRFFYNRPRPFEVVDSVRQLIAHSPGGSFPSGHAAFFFAVSMAMFFYHRVWGLIFFGITIYMSTGRIEAGLHWPTDIMGGAVVGIFSAWLVKKVFMLIKNKRPDDRRDIRQIV